MSITKLSRLGALAITVLMLAVVAFSFDHARQTNGLLIDNLFVATPARDVLQRVDGLIADSAFKFLQFVNRDSIRADDVIEALGRLVGAEKALAAALPAAPAGVPPPKRHAVLAPDREPSAACPHAAPRDCCPRRADPRRGPPRACTGHVFARGAGV